MDQREIEQRMEEFQRENLTLKKQVKEFGYALKDICSMMEEMQKTAESNMLILGQMTVRYNNLKYEICDNFLRDENKYFYPKFRSNEETLRLIIEEGKSLARFGDGEFAIERGIHRCGFQRLDDHLAARIRQVLRSSEERLLVAVADNYGDLAKYVEQTADAIRIYMDEETRMQHASLLDQDQVYSDSYITRPYVMYRDNQTDAPRKRFDALKEIWRGKRIVLVEGSQTRLGVGNDLFAGATSVRRILAPSTSSFDRYDDILQEALRVQNVDLFLLAIGPSSGVLAYDLAMEGRQAVDVGHIDMEYEWFLAGKGCRVPVPGKYNNEMTGENVVEKLHDPQYESQVIADCSCV